MLEKLSLYETKTKLYVIATDRDAQRYRVLKIDRTPAVRPPAASEGSTRDDAEELGLSITEDLTTYSYRQKEELLETLRAGNAGLKTVDKPCFGIAGFVRFTSTYHMILITKRSKVAVIGGHHIFHSEGTDLHEISPVPAAFAAEDARQRNSFMSVHLSKNFYFSYTYDVTNTLQRNLLRGREHLPYADKWVWNYHLLGPLRRSLDPGSPWLLPLVHGFVDQAKLVVYTFTARWLTFLCKAQGFVANEVESEQIVSDTLTSAFHTAAPSWHTHPAMPVPDLPPQFPPSHQARRISPRYTSHVQIRGSIPLFWTQDAAKALKPPIEMALRDPFYSAAAKHFDSLFRAYGRSCIVLNLIKHEDDRESTLLGEFKDCIDYLNQSLSEKSKIDYIAYDLSSAKASRKNNKFDVLEDCAEGALEKTGFFHSGPEAPRRCEREGRTNIAQTIVGHSAFAHQLYALGFLPSPNLDVESDAARLLESMYASHGDIIAMQYGGSNTVSTINSYRPATPAWPAFSGGYSRDKVENMKRYYANSFSDHDKQAAIDLFLGIKPDVPVPLSWTYIPPAPRRSYREWCSTQLEQLDLTAEEIEAKLQATIDEDDMEYPDDLWRRYYHGNRFQRMEALLAYQLPQQATLAPHDSGKDSNLQSPFISFSERAAILRPPSVERRQSSGGLRSWMPHRPPGSERAPKRLPSAPPQTSGPESDDEASPAPVPPAAQPFTLSTGTLASALLRPVVRPDEAREYDAWVTQFSHLSLSSHDYLSDKDRVMYEAYVRRRPASNEASAKDRGIYEGFIAAGELRALLGSVNDIAVPSTSLKMYREAVQGEKALMEHYLNPTLDSSLGFLDAPIQLEQAGAGDFAGPAQPSGVLDFEQWLNPIPAAHFDPSGGLAVHVNAGAAGPHLQEMRDAMPQAPFAMPSADYHAFEAQVQAAAYGTVDLGRSVGQSSRAEDALRSAQTLQASYSPQGLHPVRGSTSDSASRRRSVPAPVRTTRNTAGIQVSPVNENGPDTASYSIAAYGSPKSKPSLALVSARSHMTRAAAQSAQQQYMAYQSPPVSPARARPRLFQADESPDGSAASVTSTVDDDLEVESDDTSIHSAEVQNKSLAKMLFGHDASVSQLGQLETRVWQHNPDQPPLHVQRCGGPNSPPRPTGHIGSQRAASVASTQSRAGSEAPSIGSISHASPAPPPQPPRRTNSTTAGEDPQDSEDVDGGARGTTRSGRVAKRNLLAENRSGSAAKRARTSRRKDTSSLPAPPRKARRQVNLPPTLEQRSLPPHVEPHPDFPRFYRKFPVSSAFHPECFVLRPPGGSRAVAPQPRLQPAQVHPATPLSLYDDSGFGSAADYYSEPSTPLASTSASGLQGIPVDVAVPYSVYSMSHAGGDPHFAASLGAGACAALSHVSFPPHAEAGGSTSSMASLPSIKTGTPLPLTPSSTSPSTFVGPGGLPLSTGPNGLSVMQPPPDATWNKVGDPLNLYWPRFVKGSGDDKCGLCPICAEPPERGGDGEQKWFKLKNSSYVYHMSYAHGVSNVTGKPISPPVKTRVIKLPQSPKDQRSQMIEGLCHKCDAWVPLQSIKNLDAIIPELIWWKHAKKCHGESIIAGEGSHHLLDDYHALVLQRKIEHGAVDAT
ncbi:hypothetical protein RHOSPDRAFT_28774 [Rhodotorula sp. JG-1b]|nr:hypothetical protein RHOSPDRAFT_28774 [Rhodotorula sp. JG-1b]